MSRRNVSIDKCSGPNCACRRPAKVGIQSILLTDLNGAPVNMDFGPPPTPPLMMAALAVRERREAMRLRQRWLNE